MLVEPRDDELGASGRPIRAGVESVMTKRITTMCAAALAFSALPTVLAAATDALAQIEALEARFAAAVKAKDAEAIMRLYVPGESLAVFDVAPPRQYVGAAAYRKNWEGIFATVKGPLTFTISDLAISADYNLAYSHSIQHARLRKRQTLRPDDARHRGLPPGWRSLADRRRAQLGARRPRRRQARPCVEAITVRQDRRRRFAAHLPPPRPVTEFRRLTRRYSTAARNLTVNSLQIQRAMPGAAIQN